MKRSLALLALVIGVLAATPAWAESPLGRWWNDQRDAQIEVSERAGALSGAIVWLKNRRDDGTPFRDTENPDPALRDRHVQGITIFRGLKPGRKAGTWDGGTIYDPDTGNIYRCKMTLKNADTLEVRGFLGMALFGRSTTWIRVQAEESAPAE